MKTRVSVWGVLLSPVWLFFKLVIFVGNVIGGLASSVLQWAAGIAFVLDIIVWITMGFGMFMLVMIPIVLCFAFPYIWGFAFGILDAACDGIAYLWHIPVNEDKHSKRQGDSKYYDGTPKASSNNTHSQSNLFKISQSSEEDWEPEGYAEFKTETERMNSEKPDRPVD